MRVGLPLKQPEQEKREARMDGATLVPNSGRGFRKGDAVLDDWLIDYKHNNVTFSITVKNWRKHKKDAWNDGRKEPVYKVVLEDDVKVAVIDWEHFLDYKKLLEEQND